ncbi:uncharacterized protein [Nicotiana tomentosiformis]|uniref:uncharacterized protein n=1 Tax=Nicotiana tomentosiformis TaxID=4098 RepID=UPI00388C875A
MRHFNPEWFRTSCSQWLEYSIKQDASFYFCCYLFKNEVGGYGKKVGDAFTTDGFRGWNKDLEKLKSYVGDVNSVHNRCFKMMLDLMNQAQSILTSLDKQSGKIKSEHRVCLNASIDMIRYLLKEGMPFRGHDESIISTRRGHFLDLLKWYANRKEDVKNVVLEKALKNNTMTSPNIQKDVVNSCAKETVKAIIEDLNGNFFRILVDESKDVSHKEQMALVMRYVNKEAVAKKHQDVNNFFDILANVLNVVGGSYKRREMIRDDQAEKLDELLVLGEGSNYHEKAPAKSLVEDIRSYKFVCILHLMLKKLAITYDLNMALQRKDQDIISAMKLVDFSKRQLQTMRESKWNSLMEDVSLFCDKNCIVIPKMDENRFSEVNTDLFLGMASLSTDDSFASYDKNKIMKLATYYLNEFTDSKLEDLSRELDKYINYVQEIDNAFSNLKELGDLSNTMVKTNIHKTWGLIYLPVKLSLILPMATATVERAFSSMEFIKNDLRSRIGDNFLNDCLVCYIEDEVFESVPNDAIIDRFLNMTSHRVQLK